MKSFAIALVSFSICFIVLLKITEEKREIKAMAAEKRTVLEKKEIITKDPVINPKNVTKMPMGEKKFVGMANSMAKGLGLDVNRDLFSMMYEYGMKNSVPPFLVAGVGWKESHYNPNAQGPETRYGRARGMYQFIDSTSSALGYKAEEMYHPKTAIKAGSELLNEYSNHFFAGKAGKIGMKKEFYRFKAKGQYATYNERLVTDEKGKPLPRLLLGTMSYNSGPMRIVQSLDKYGFVVMNPADSRWSLPHQTLQYVLLIDKHFYDFGYDFHYSQNDIDTIKVANNQ